MMYNAAMIQDIFPHKFDNHFIPGLLPDDNDTLFCFRGEQILCHMDEGRAVFPRAGDCADKNSLIYLFRLDGQRFFLGSEENTPVSGDYVYLPLRSLRKKDEEQKPLVFAAVTARHLNDWYRSCRFCGCCGHLLQHSDSERAMVCPSCGRVFYPRINPAVIVGVTKGDEILLTKYAGRGHVFYALIAGFTEIGETFEETVKREVMEEVGLQVTNIRYYKSQPWGFAADILCGYYCDVEGDPSIHPDMHELKEAIWVPRKDVPGQPDDFSLTNEMMLAFRDGPV